MKKFLTFIFCAALIFSIGNTTVKSVKAATNENNIKPIHQYIFQKDKENTVVDTGTMAGTDGKFNGKANGAQIVSENGMIFRRFSGNDNINFNDILVPIGKKSIKFKYRQTSIPKQQQILFTNQKDLNNGNGIYICFEVNGDVGFYISDGNGWNNGIFYIAGKVPHDNNFHTVQFDWDGTVKTDSVKMFVDSVKVTTATPARLETKVPSANLFVGSYGSGILPFMGDLAGLEIYNDIKEEIIEESQSDRAILAITMVNGITKEYNLSMDEVNKFTNWFDESNGKGQVKYGFDKKISPYKKVKEYVIFDKIVSYEIREFDNDK